MSARTLYKATVYVGDQHVPVRIVGAIEDRKLHFRLLHATDRVPVVQQMVHARTGEPVPRDEVRKAYEVEPGRVVVLTPEALAALAPASDRRIDVTQVVSRARLPAPCLDRPYYLAPDGDEAAYFALARALQERERAAIVAFTMRKRQYHGALLGEHGHLMLITLHDPRGLVLPSSLPVPEPVALDAKQLQLAEQLVEAMREPFELATHHDEHRTRVLELLERKRAGRPAPTVVPRTRPQLDDLAQALERSLEEARRERRVA